MLENSLTMSIPESSRFVAIIDGKSTSLFILSNKNGMQAAITNYGGRLVSLLVPDANGETTDIVVGFDNITDYQHAIERYFGAIIGRYANRIGFGRFILNETEYNLPLNLHPHNLHGGFSGFQDKVWDVEESTDQHLKLHYFSPHLEGGFPGNLHVWVTYILNDDNELEIMANAECDMDTIFDVTYHPFFNLNGQGNGNILKHQLTINADSFLAIDENQLPTGALLPVENTPFDFRTAHTIGAQIHQQSEQLKWCGGGYDHYYVLRDDASHSLKFAASVIGDLSGIEMKVYTTAPGLQFCSGQYLNGQHTIKGNCRDEQYGSFCLEPHRFLDAPNHPEFPTTILRSGEVYATTTIFSFRK